MNAMKTAQEMAAVMMTYREGQQWQWAHKMGEKWRDHHGQPEWNWGYFSYRIKPEAELRAWKPQEVPTVPMSIRQSFAKDNSWVWHVLTIQNQGVAVCDNKKGCHLITWDDLLEKYDYSINGRTWNKCGVMEDAP